MKKINRKYDDYGSKVKEEEITESDRFDQAIKLIMGIGTIILTAFWIYAVNKPF